MSRDLGNREPGMLNRGTRVFQAEGTEHAKTQKQERVICVQ